MPTQDGAGNNIGSFYDGQAKSIGTIYQGDGTVLWAAGPDIPSSVVSRTQDDNVSTGLAEKRGLAFVSDDDWAEIEGVISANTVGLTTAYIYRISDQTLMDSVDISGLSAGDTFRFDNAGLSANTDYAMVADAGGANYDGGQLEPQNFPYESSDSRLRIIGRVVEQNNYAVEDKNPFNIVTLGNVSG